MNLELETPYFLIDKAELDNNLAKMKKAADAYFKGGFIVGYSYKTNSLPWIVKYFKDNDCYAEVVSDDEYNLGKHIGVQKSHFVYNGIIKSKNTFLEALSNGCVVNLDSNREIEWLDELDNSKKYNIGIRVNFDLEKECPGETQCGLEGGRFGFCYENGELDKAIKLVQSKGFTINGLHLHCSSKTRSLSIYKAIAKYAGFITKEYNLDLSFLDIGGGFFGGLSDKPQFSDYFKLISNILLEYVDLAKIKVIIEPGMSLIGSCISYVTTVIDVKDTSYNRFVIIDGSRIHIDPLMTKKNYFFDVESRGSNNHSKQVICGFTCMEHDRLMTIENELELSVGDKIVFNKVGAYTMCLSPLFIKYYPSVYLQENCKKILVRKRWGAEEYCSNGELL